MIKEFPTNKRISVNDIGQTFEIITKFEGKIIFTNSETTDYLKYNLYNTDLHSFNIQNILHENTDHIFNVDYIEFNPTRDIKSITIKSL